MKRIMVATVAIVLVSGPAAWAQHGGGGRGGGHGGGGGGAHGGGGPGGGFGGDHGGGARGGDHEGFRGGDHHGFHGARAGLAGAAVGAGMALGAAHAFHGGDHFGAAPGFRGGAGFSRGLDGYRFVGSRGEGYGPHGEGRWAYHGREFDRFRVGAFRYPYGWGYRRWGVGAFLPALFLTDTYYIGDWGGFDLGPPPPDCRWVRYGPDALLVNVYTGEVVDVAYGVFWW